MMAQPTAVAASTNLGEQSDSLAISYLIRAYQVCSDEGCGLIRRIRARVDASPLRVGGANRSLIKHNVQRS